MLFKYANEALSCAYMQTFSEPGGNQQDQIDKAVK